MPNRTKQYRGETLSKRSNSTDKRKQPRPVPATGGGQVGLSTGAAVQL